MQKSKNLRYAVTGMLALCSLVLFGCSESSTGGSGSGKTSLEGTWIGYDVSNPGNRVELSFTGKEFVFYYNGAESYRGTMSLRQMKTPKEFDATITESAEPEYVGKISLGIYSVSNDTLMFAGNEPGVTVRPTSFSPGGNTMVLLLVKQDSGPTPPLPVTTNELEGNWVGALIDEPSIKATFNFHGKSFVFLLDTLELFRGTITLRTSVTPRQVDLYITQSVEAEYVGKTSLGIYQISNDVLLFAFNEPGATVRPVSFTPAEQTIVLRLIKNGTGPEPVSGDKYEPDPRSSAPIVTVNSTALARELPSANDTDWVRFNALSNTIYLITVSGDARAYVYLEDAADLKYGAMPSSFSSTEPGAKHTESIRWTCTTPGTYYVKIIPASYSPAYGAYRVSVTVLPPQNTGISVDYLCWASFNLGRLDGNTGRVTVFENGSFDFFTDMEYGPDGRLYGVSSSLELINPQTGKTSEIGTFRYSSSSSILMGDAAFSPDGKLYVTSLVEDSLFTVNLSTAELTFVGIAPGGGFDFDAQGKLYCGNFSLILADPVTLDTISIIGSYGRFLPALFFNPARTSLMAHESYPSDSLYSVNLATAGIRGLLQMGNCSISCMVEERPTLTKTLFQPIEGNHRHSKKELLDLRAKWMEARMNAATFFFEGLNAINQKTDIR